MSHGGQTASDLMTLNSVLTAGPFVVSSQNNTTWIQGDEQTSLGMSLILIQLL
jgi:hypothetical protein